ncbi:MAG: isomerase [Devosia sp.]|uniref:sugar phosphate isomerase/epimerase family protein n=1 Tax=Devosia sp. TaxID=1871048 RepID=UPI0026093ACB|nr:sugar phosphate isomerase/epimerase family protein [Devosia sp.]MDB5540393.1 isomerase [Devosia sp.]
MKLGFNLLLWTTHVTDEHRPIIERLKATGYDGVEIPMFEGTPDHYEKLGRRLRDIGLEATGVGVMAGGNAISPDRAQRNGALAHLNWLSDCTAALGGTLVCGPFHQPLGEFSGRGPTADEIAWCADVHKAAAQHAARSGVALSVEPLNRFECYFLNTMEQAASLVRRVDEPNYGYLFDTFHTNIEEDHPFDLIPATIRQINHAHISENNRGVPGAGHIDFQSVFNTLKQSSYDGWMTIEAFGSALPDLAAATKIWRPLFGSEAEVYEKGYKLMREGWDGAR